uniref:lipase family protein n=1 Tax=Nocardia takedensis TaxID=259390 RepID=UPI00278C1B94|nr:lipase family protein [Nocardia takedensis]
MGARVLVVDYIGLGTPGIHTFANRIEGAHAVLDAARAANALAGVDADAPVVFWGYSQGGGATAAAAEMQPTYAPELNLKGTWAGGPVADLAAILERIDGALIGGVVGSSRPATPVLITSGRNDDTVPYGQARQLALDWCAQGATVTFRTNELPPILPGATIPAHFGPELIEGFGPDNAVTYLLDRLADKPVSGCSPA